MNRPCAVPTALISFAACSQAIPYELCTLDFSPAGTVSECSCHSSSWGIGGPAPVPATCDSAVGTNGYCCSDDAGCACFANDGGSAPDCAASGLQLVSSCFAGGRNIAECGGLSSTDACTLCAYENCCEEFVGCNKNAGCEAFVSCQELSCMNTCPLPAGTCAVSGYHCTDGGECCSGSCNTMSGGPDYNTCD